MFLTAAARYHTSRLTEHAEVVAHIELTISVMRKLNAEQRAQRFVSFLRANRSAKSRKRSGSMG
jgi:hypothetical protein